MTIRLLFNAGDDLKGAVLDVDEGRAQRLIRTGYAEAVAPIDAAEMPKKRKKETSWPSKV
jgi:hypothetical protein